MCLYFLYLLFYMIVFAWPYLHIRLSVNSVEDAGKNLNICFLSRLDVKALDTIGYYSK